MPRFFLLGWSFLTPQITVVSEKDNLIKNNTKNFKYNTTVCEHFPVFSQNFEN